MKRLLTALVLVAIGVGAFLYVRSQKSSSSISSGNFGASALAHTQTVLSYGPRPTGSEALNKTRAFLSDQLKASKWVLTEQSFERPTPVGRKTFTNLIARFSTDGNVPKAGQIDLILGAHIDSKDIKEFPFLGADDAASSAGALLVIAKELSQSPDLACRVEIVFFDGEEGFGPAMTMTDGLYGSRYYASLWRDEARKPAAGILLDMIGHKDLKIAIPSDSPEPLSKILFDAVKSEKLEQHFTTLDIPVLDDHVPVNNAGIPMIDLVGDFRNFTWWHQQSDDGSNLSAESLDKSIRIVLRMSRAILEGKKTSDL